MDEQNTLKRKWSDIDYQIANTMIKCGMRKVVMTQSAPVCYPMEESGLRPIESPVKNAFKPIEIGQEEFLQKIVYEFENQEKRIFDEKYPCGKCDRKDICNAEHGCNAWREWFKYAWNSIRNEYRKTN